MAKDKILERLKKGVAQMESSGGKNMYNLDGSSATGLYGQLFDASYLKNVSYMQGVSRKEFAEDLDLQNKLFEDAYYGRIKDHPGLKNGIGKIRKDYPDQAANIADDEIAALINMLGRDGTREYFGNVLRDKKPLATATNVDGTPSYLRKIYGPNAEFKNKTPKEYIAQYRDAIGDFVGPTTEKEFGFDPNPPMEYPEPELLGEGGMNYGVPKYLFGGKKFKDTKVGKGLRDVGVATLNTAASPFEALLGTDFGIDEKFGYKTKFGEVYGGVGEFAGSALGSLAPAALNTVAPGLGTAIQIGGQALGSGLESADITKDISTDPQSFAGAGVGTTLGMFSDFMPNSGVNNQISELGQSGIMQGFAGLFMPPPNPVEDMKYGGQVQGDIEVESGEVIKFEKGGTKSFNPKANLKPLGNNTVEVTGKELHSKKGVDLRTSEGNSEIYSNALKNPETGNTFAQDAKELQRQRNIAEEQSKSTDTITRQTGEASLAMLGPKEKNLFAMQQRMNKNATSTTQGMYGMRYNKAQNGARSITLPGINRPEGISSSMYGLGFDPQSMMGMEPGAYSNMNQSMSLPVKGTEGNYQGRRTIQPGMKYGGRLMKAGDGLQAGNYSNMFGQPNMSVPGFNSTIPGANTFNMSQGPNLSMSQFGNLENSQPGNYSQSNYFQDPSKLQQFLPYLPSLYNLGVGTAGALGGAGQLDPEDYTSNFKATRSNVNMDAISAPLKQTAASFFNAEQNPMRRQAFASQLAPRLAQVYGQGELMQGRMDAQADMLDARASANDPRMRFAVDQTNMGLAAMPQQFINQGFQGATSTAQQQGNNQMMMNLIKMLG